MQEYKVKAIVHSQECEGVQEVTMLVSNSSNDCIVLTSDGVKCHAIYNIFSNLYYADDIYSVIKGEN